jgi:large subunit ribosomal protein L12|tara:strand:- start:108 stop:425 length:318 start_codon:yes stop_codon:yes gene_type:complete
MEYIYAALLLHKLEKPIDEENIKKVISATGIKADEVKIKALVASLGEVNIEEALKNTNVTTTVAQPATETGDKKSDEKPAEKEAAKEEDGAKEEEALEGLSGLFG